MSTEISTVRNSGSGVAAFGWALGALVVAVALSFATSILFDDVLDAAIDPLFGPGVVPDVIVATGTALIVGGAIGAVIGSRVTRGAVTIAVVTTVFYLSMWPFVALFMRGFLVPLSLALHVVAAGGAALVFQRRSTKR